MSCLLQRFFIPAILLMYTCLSLFAQNPTPPKATGSVAGRITDGEKPIPGITVTARDSTVNSLGQSDLRGRSVTVQISEGVNQITVRVDFSATRKEGQ